MYQANGTYYTEKHSVSFGDLVRNSSQGQDVWTFSEKANTWKTWHLIPSSQPSVAHPNPITKIIEIPGVDGVLDLSEYLTGRITYGQRQGSLNFYIANDLETRESIRMDMVRTLHGKTMKMQLDDDKEFYYEGRFTVGNLESGPSYSAISIGYNLAPYKLRLSAEGMDAEHAKWDPFNFDTDYDYYTALNILDPVNHNYLEAGTYHLFMDSMPVTLSISLLTGSMTAEFGGVSKFLNGTGASATLGLSTPGDNVLKLTGNTGKARIFWRRGAL